MSFPNPRTPRSAVSTGNDFDPDFDNKQNNTNFMTNDAQAYSVNTTSTQTSHVAYLDSHFTGQQPAHAVSATAAASSSSSPSEHVNFHYSRRSSQNLRTLSSGTSSGAPTAVAPAMPSTAYQQQSLQSQSPQSSTSEWDNINPFPVSRSFSIKRPHKYDDGLANDMEQFGIETSYDSEQPQALKDPRLSAEQHSPTHKYHSQRPRITSSFSDSNLARQRAESISSSKSSGSNSASHPRIHFSSAPIITTSSSSDARTSSYNKKAIELGVTGLNLTGSTSIPLLASQTLPTPSTLSPQKRKGSSVNFTISNGRAIVSTLNSNHDIEPPSSFSRQKSPEDRNTRESGNRSHTPKAGADDAITALKQVIARNRPKLSPQASRSRAMSVPVPVGVIAALDTPTVIDTSVILPPKKRVCSSALPSPQGPPLSPSVLQSPYTALNSPVSGSGAPSTACDSVSSKHGSPVSDTANSPIYGLAIGENPRVKDAQNKVKEQVQLQQQQAILRTQEEQLQQQLHFQNFQNQQPHHGHRPQQREQQIQEEQMQAQYQLQLQTQQHFLQQQQFLFAQQQGQVAQQVHNSSHSDQLAFQPQTMIPQQQLMASMPQFQLANPPVTQPLEMAIDHEFAEPSESYYNATLTNTQAQYQMTYVDGQQFYTASPTFTPIQPTAPPITDEAYAQHPLQYQQYQFQQQNLQPQQHKTLQPFQHMQSRFSAPQQLIPTHSQAMLVSGLSAPTVATDRARSAAGPYGIN